MQGPPTVTLRKTHSHQYKALYWSYILWPQKALVPGDKETAAEALDAELRMSSEDTCHKQEHV